MLDTIDNQAFRDLSSERQVDRVVDIIAESLEIGIIRPQYEIFINEVALPRIQDLSTRVQACWAIMTRFDHGSSLYKIADNWRAITMTQIFEEKHPGVANQPDLTAENYLGELGNLQNEIIFHPNNPFEKALKIFEL